MMNSVRVEIVRIENFHVDVFSIGPFFRYCLKRQASREFRHTHCLLSSSRDGTGFLRSTSPDSYSDEYDALFSLVSETSRPIKSCRVGNPLDDRFFSPANN